MKKARTKWNSVMTAENTTIMVARPDRTYALIALTRRFQETISRCGAVRQPRLPHPDRIPARHTGCPPRDPHANSRRPWFRIDDDAIVITCPRTNTIPGLRENDS